MSTSATTGAVPGTGTSRGSPTGGTFAGDQARKADQQQPICPGQCVDQEHPASVDQQLIPVEIYTELCLELEHLNQTEASGCAHRAERLAAAAATLTSQPAQVPPRASSQALVRPYQRAQSQSVQRLPSQPATRAAQPAQPTDPDELDPCGCPAPCSRGHGYQTAQSQVQPHTRTQS